MKLSTAKDLCQMSITPLLDSMEDVNFTIHSFIHIKFEIICHLSAAK